jgi:hypothetical protein
MYPTVTAKDVHGLVVSLHSAKLSGIGKPRLTEPETKISLMRKMPKTRAK